MEALAPWTRARAGEQRRNWISKYFVLRGYLLCWSHHTTSDVDFEIVNVSFLSIQIKKRKHISTQFSHKSHPLTQLKTSWSCSVLWCFCPCGIRRAPGFLGGGAGPGASVGVGAVQAVLVFQKKEIVLCRRVDTLYLKAELVKSRIEFPLTSSLYTCKVPSDCTLLKSGNYHIKSILNLKVRLLTFWAELNFIKGS